MSNLVENFLEEQGFNEKDREIYLDLHRHGQSFASTIALRTGIDRTTVYSVLRRLVVRGIVLQTDVNDVRAYLPVAPEVFVDKVEREMDELKAKKKMAQLFVAELEGMQGSSFVKSKVKIYDGVEGIINLYEQTLVKGSTQKAFINLKNVPEEVMKFLKGRFIKEKVRKKVKSFVIVGKSRFSERYQKLDRKSNRETRIVERMPFDLHSEIVLFGGREVAIIDFHQQIYGMVIESETFYRTVEALFDYVWKVEG